MKSGARMPWLGLALAVVFLGAGSAVGLAQCHFPATGRGRVMTYSFVPIVTPAGMVLHVSLNFQGGSEGTEEIEVPTEWAGEKLHAVTTRLHRKDQRLPS